MTNIPTIFIALAVAVVGAALFIGLVLWLNHWRHENKYKTIRDVQRMLRDLGMENSNLILAVDFTKSNEVTGKNTFGGRCLHHLQKGMRNPYQSVIRVIGKTLEVFDEDNFIPAMGFGDMTCRDVGVFPFYPDRDCRGFDEVLKRYNEITPHVQLGGPTSFAPVIKDAVRIVRQTGKYHILVIIADGTDTYSDSQSQQWKEKETRDAVIEAADYPLSIIMVGVGDGPFGLMEQLDDLLPKRSFDNFQFVHYNATRQAKFPDVNFALLALEEIPDQYRAIKKLGLLNIGTAEARAARRAEKREKASFKAAARAVAMTGRTKSAILASELALGHKLKNGKNKGRTGRSHSTIAPEGPDLSSYLEQQLADSAMSNSFQMSDAQLHLPGQLALQESAYDAAAATLPANFASEYQQYAQQMQPRLARSPSEAATNVPRSAQERLQEQQAALAKYKSTSAMAVASRSRAQSMFTRSPSTGARGLVVESDSSSDDDGPKSKQNRSSSGNNRPAAGTPAKARAPATLTRQESTSDESKLCKVCMDNPIDMLLLPCRHLVCCRVCSGKVKKCPVCREEIVSVIEVFQS